MNKELTQTIASEVQLFQSVEQKEDFTLFTRCFTCQGNQLEKSRRYYAARTSRISQNFRLDGN